jgi:hypothetical protein
MKINIGPYKSDLIPIHRWEQSYEFWRRPDTCYLPEDEYTKWDKVVFWVFDRLRDITRPINLWANNRERKIKVHVDYYDIWSADHTLALVIHPVLLKLKQEQHGYPHVKDEDVPEELRTEGKSPESWTEKDDNRVKSAWDYVLGEMIWAFEQCSKEDKGDDIFYHNSEQLELITTKQENASYYSVDFNYQKDPTKPKYYVDDDAKKLHYDRIQNGLNLFAKYYFNLWD